MSDLPDPPVPADCDLRGLPYYPLNLQRLIRSSFHNQASAAEWRAGLLLWMKSWDQLPAGSLPDNDRELSSLAEVRDIRQWLKMKPVSLHGWTLHSDGRLYHPVVTEVTLLAWDKRQANRHRTQAASEARWSPIRNGLDNGIRNGARNGHQVVREKVEGSEEPVGSSSLFPSEANASSGNNRRDARARSAQAEFAEFWQAYPRKVGKDAAAQKYLKIRKTVDAHTLLDAARRYADSVVDAEDKRFIAHPTTWLNQGRWQDEEVPSTPLHDYPTEPPPPLSEMWKDC